MKNDAMISIRMPKELKAAIEDAARAERKSVSEYVATILERQTNVKRILNGSVKLVLQ